MKPAKTRQAVALPKALLPDPDALLLHIDRAVMATEYARATQDLTSMPPGPSIFNIPAKTSQSTSKDADDSGKKAGGFLQGSLVEDFLQKVSSSNTERRRSRTNRKHTASAPSEAELSLPQPRSSVAKYPSASCGLTMLKESVATADSRLDSYLPPQGSNSQLNILNASPVSVTRFNPLAQDIQLERPLAAKVTFFHPARSSLRAKAFSLPSNDSGSECEFYDGERTSSASSTCTGSPVERLRQGSPRMFSGLDLTSLLGKLDMEDKQDASNEVPTQQYDALAADQAYRAGSAAMEEGDMLQAIALLRLASIKCPRNRPSALVKIEKLITAAAQQLEMQEASRNNDDAIDVVEHEPNEVEVERRMPMKVLAVGDMLKADEAYRAGVASLEAGEPEKALEHLETALLACPADRRNAATKIQALIDQANFELRMRVWWFV
ncbi:hypothetical protein R1flu_024922 [Riccia fluitans]|uniref:Uncharacterized protein n=1 Tax=Riccia fluitans TaxID=41844 RepID=A0ABD1XWA3_9MARC